MKMKILFLTLNLLLFVFVASSAKIKTPMGEIESECIHEVESGSKIEEREGITTVTSNDGSKRVIKKCNYDFKSDIKRHYQKKYFPSSSAVLNVGEYDGWLSYTFFNSTTDYTFTDFLGYFSVPENPVKSPAPLFIFTGLQNFGPVKKKCF